MSYDTTLTIRLPYSVAMAAIAAKIGRALDPDVGGHKSFSRDVTGYDGETPVYGDTMSTTTPCTTGFKEQCMAMMTNPEALYYVCMEDYGTRWEGLTPPTVEECYLFCNAIIPEPVVT